MKRWIAGPLFAMAGLAHAAGAHEDLATTVALIQRGELAAAQAALPAVADTPLRERLERVIAVRRALAARLLQQAGQDLAEARLTAALQRADLALAIDRALAETPATRQLQQRQAAHEQALAALSVCTRRREPLCLRNALARVRQDDRPSAAAMQAELQAADWYRLSAGDALRAPDAPTGVR